MIKKMKFPPSFDTKVDMRKVELAVLKPWIAKKIIELLGFEDDVLIEYVSGLLEDTENTVRSFPLPPSPLLTRARRSSTRRRCSSSSPASWSARLPSSCRLSGPSSSPPSPTLSAYRPSCSRRRSRRCVRARRTRRSSGGGRSRVGRAGVRWRRLGRGRGGRGMICVVEEIGEDEGGEGMEEETVGGMEEIVDMGETVEGMGEIVGEEDTVEEIVEGTRADEEATETVEAIEVDVEEGADAVGSTTAVETSAGMEGTAGPVVDATTVEEEEEVPAVTTTAYVLFSLPRCQY